MGPYGQGDGIGRSGINVGLLAVHFGHDVPIKDIFLQRHDLDAFDLGIQCVEYALEKVVRQRANHLHFLQRDRNRFSLVLAHPDGQVAIGPHLAQDDESLRRH